MATIINLIVGNGFVYSRVDHPLTDGIGGVVENHNNVTEVRRPLVDGCGAP